jgi:hypothetical protein
MKTPLSWKIKSAIFGFIRHICNHYYGCCNNITKNCDKCKYVKDEDKLC